MLKQTDKPLYWQCVLCSQCCVSWLCLQTDRTTHTYQSRLFLSLFPTLFSLSLSPLKGEDPAPSLIVSLLLLSWALFLSLQAMGWTIVFFWKKALVKCMWSSLRDLEFNDRNGSSRYLFLFRWLRCSPFAFFPSSLSSCPLLHVTSCSLLLCFINSLPFGQSMSFFCASFEIMASQLLFYSACMLNLRSWT